LSEEEEKKLSRLEKRLVANVDFDDQALNYLGFGTDIYYMLGHLGWVQLSNGVSADTHKEFALEILMTIAPILDDGVQSLSFRLEGVQQVDPYEYVRELLGFQKGAPEKVDVSPGMCNTLILLKFWLYKNLLATIYLPKEYKVVYLFLGI
jgi:hypothetical protein